MDQLEYTANKMMALETRKALIKGVDIHDSRFHSVVWEDEGECPYGSFCQI